jgi:hypothetical protein
VHDDAQASQAAPAFEPAKQVVGQRYSLKRRSQDKLTRMNDERFFGLYLDKPGRPRGGFLTACIDVGLLVPLKDEEVMAHPHVNSIWADAVFQASRRLYLNLAVLEGLADIAVR